MNSVPHRIDLVIKYYNMTYNSFAKSLGMANGTGIKTMVDKDRNPQQKTLNRIEITYPDVDMNWLRTGAGNMVSNVPESLSGNDDLTVTSKQVINQLDINNKHYTAILENKLRDDRKYYDNDSNHVKNIAKILKGFLSLQERMENKFTEIAEKMDATNKYWSEQSEAKHKEQIKEGQEQKELFLLALDKVLHIEQDLDNIKSFMAIGFEKQAIKKADKKIAKKISNKKLTKK